MRGLSLIVSALLLIGLALGTARAEPRRVALVIGNDNYEHLNVLKKAVADAKAYAATLRDKGFDSVNLGTDLTRAEMDGAIATFVEELQPGDTAIFVYSGHGWSDGNQNFIIGTDAPASGSAEFLSRISIPLRNGIGGVIDDMDRHAAGLKVAIIDACRDNPFTPVPGKKSVAFSRGLVRIDPPTGTFVIFSAGAGQSSLDRLSEDDPIENSVFTRAFLPLLRSDLDLQEAVKSAQTQVVAMARSIKVDQKPAYYDEVVGEACLSKKCGNREDGDRTNDGVNKVAETRPLGALQGPGADPAPAPVSEDLLAWNAIKDSSSIAVLRSFIQRYPDSFYRTFAEARLSELEEAAEKSDARARAEADAVAQARADAAALAREQAAASAAIRAQAEAEAAAAAARAEARAAAEQRNRDFASADPGLPAGGGNWVVILGSFPHAARADADQRRSYLASRGIGAKIIDTDNYSNLTDGYYSVVLGPYSKSRAQQTLSSVKGVVGDAYIKAMR